MIHPLVSDHKDAVADKYGAQNVFAVCLYGSQNYNLSMQESDVDTKAMIIPSMKDVILARKPVSTEMNVAGGICNIKDVRLMFDNFCRGNINFLEILFTADKIVNPIYSLFWRELQENRHLIANANPRRLLHAAAGMAKQKYQAMEHPFESKAEVLSLYGYDPKQLHHLVRLEHFISAYLDFNSFAAALVPDKHDYLLSLKINPLPLKEARELKEQTRANISNLISTANSIYITDPPSAAEAREFLDDLAVRLLTFTFEHSFL